MDPRQFYEVLPDGRYRFRIDHHTINDYNLCDRYFKFRHLQDVDGKVWGGKTLNIKIAIGSWWSNVMEYFYHEMTYSTLPTEHHMYKFATDAWAELDMGRYAKQDEKSREVYDKFGGVDGARLMALEYYQAFAKAHFQQWTVVGAELGFGWKDELLLGEDDHVVVYYGGKPDLVIWDRAQNMVLPLDHKTKDAVPGNVSVMFKPHPQTAGYIFAVSKLLDRVTVERAANHTLSDLPGSMPKAPTKCVIMMAARFRPTEKPRDGIRKPRFVPVYPNYSADEIEEWRQSVMEKCRRLRDSIERNVWTPRESACHLFYNGCMFRRVCSVPANVREATLRSDFVKIDPWKPYDIEED